MTNLYISLGYFTEIIKKSQRFDVGMGQVYDIINFMCLCYSQKK
ncbi:hypothetical protein PLAN_160176 [Planktothrix rubescens CCAP 1459/22]|uniref:Uncharacterized protein n=1 Tax=Planktothrix rubescens CCAP 1459/22 TaxID=329571 RepID=A0A6J7ZKS6_PLARU|nr:hypothetical protein PLAN_160176 [Planktothrix rubescens NIVA-CYA 18]